MISLNYKCSSSKDAKTGLGLVRGCLVRLLVELDVIQVASEYSCTVYNTCTATYIYITVGTHALLHYVYKSKFLVLMLDERLQLTLWYAYI